MTSNKVTAVPFNHITTSSCYLKENRSKKDGSLNNVLKFIKEWLRIPVVLLMLFMTTHGRPSSALAFSGGAMGGYSFSSSNSSSNWGSSTSYTTSRKEVDLCQDKDSDTAAAVVFLIALCVVIYWIMDKLRYKTRVFKVQVGLVVDGQSLQKDLNRIAKTTDSSSEAGWEHMLEGTISSLLQHDKYWISGSSYVTREYKNEKNAEEHFKKLSRKERKKFSEETLVNLDGMEKEHIISKQANKQFSNTYMVVTIVMAASKMSNLESHIPTIFYHEDVKKALDELLRINDTSIIEKKNEVLSLKEFRENYPSLKVLFQSVPAQLLGNDN